MSCATFVDLCEKQTRILLFCFWRYIFCQLTLIFLENIKTPPIQSIFKGQLEEHISLQGDSPSHSLTTQGPLYISNWSTERLSPRTTLAIIMLSRKWTKERKVLLSKQTMTMALDPKLENLDIKILQFRIAHQVGNLEVRQDKHWWIHMNKDGQSWTWI